MIIYEITAKVQDELIEKFERFMKETHIPDLLRTGKFESGDIIDVSPGRYQIRYFAKSRKLLDLYLQGDAEELRKDFIKHFPTGVELSRKIVEQ